jgi:hypothetical protein
MRTNVASGVEECEVAVDTEKEDSVSIYRLGALSFLMNDLPASAQKRCGIRRKQQRKRHIDTIKEQAAIKENDETSRK